MTEKKRLTIADPVDKELLTSFRDIQNAKGRLALELLELEDQKVQLLTSSKKLNIEHQRLFQKILVERGLPVDADAQLDADSGMLRLPEEPEVEPQEP